MNISNKITILINCKTAAFDLCSKSFKYLRLMKKTIIVNLLLSHRFEYNIMYHYSACIYIYVYIYILL